MENKSEVANWFQIAGPLDKIAQLPTAIGCALALTEATRETTPARDVQVVAPHELPPKPGLSSADGQARLLHDLANIELQAMELAMRTLREFPEAPAEFRKELAEIALSEGRHLELCLKGIDALGFRWGDWPVHLGLWAAVSDDDSLLDRILIVHRYLEGSGLDAGDSILRRLTGVGNKAVRDIVSVIVREEVGHVLFGSRWYRTVAAEQLVDPEIDFSVRMAKIAKLIPRRERLARQLREQAGFTVRELEILENLS